MVSHPFSEWDKVNAAGKTDKGLFIQIISVFKFMEYLFIS